MEAKTERYLELLIKDEKYDLESFNEFSKQIKRSSFMLKELLTMLKEEDKRIYAYGAPAKGNTLLNYFQIDKTLVDKAVEINELKIGNYLPQSHIPIVREDTADLPDYYLLLSHNFEEEILKRNENIRKKGVKFIIPFPEIQIK